MNRRLCSLLGLTSLFVATFDAAGQAGRPPTPPEPAPSAPAPSAAPATVPSSDAANPPMPVVDDPMLADVAPPGRSLSDWRQALRFVRNQSTQLRISRAQVLQGQAEARRALAAALPSVTGNASLTRHLLFGRGVNFLNSGLQTNARIPNPATSFNAGIDFRQPILALGSWYAIGTAKQQTHALELSAKDAERVLLGTAAEAAVNVITAERASEISRVSLRSALSTLDLTRRRALLGASSAVDVLRAEQEVSLSRSQLVQSDEAVMRARESLGLALGDDKAWGVNPKISLLELANTARAVCHSVGSIEARSDVKAAQMRLRVAERNKKAVDYRYAPTLDLTSNINYTNNANRSPNAEHVTWTVGGLLTWPLYDGGDRYGDRMRAEAAALIVQEELTNAKRSARIEVIQANRAVDVARANLDVSQRSRDLAAESARLSRVAFVNGSGTSFDLVDTAQRLREAELDLVIKEFELVRAQIASFLSEANCNL